MKNSEKKLPPQVVFNFREEDMSEVDSETGEDNPNFIYEEDDEPTGALQGLEIVEKPAINNSDIFEQSEEEEVEIIKESIKPEKKVIFKDNEKPLKPVKPKVSDGKEKKKRKPMSEEHKAKLKIAREKAMAVRKANAIERKQMKAVDNEEKELLKKQKVKRVQKLKKEVESDEDEIPVIGNHPTREKAREPSYPTSTITKKDLEDAQLDAIMKYEAMRKQRKAEKKQAELVEKERLKMLNTINKATGGSNYRYGDGSNRFDRCY